MQNNLQMFHALNHTKVTPKCFSTTTYPSLPLVQEGNDWVLYGESTQVKTVGKNLFDKSKKVVGYLGDNTYIRSDNASSYWGFIKCEKNTQYAISKSFGGGRFKIACSMKSPKVDDMTLEMSGFIDVGNATTSYIYTTTSTAEFLIIQYYLSTVDISEPLLQVERNNIVTAYTAYTPPIPSANAESPIVNTYKKGNYQNTIGGILYQFELDNDLLQCGSFKDKLTINTVNKTIKIDRNCIKQVLKGDSSDGVNIQISKPIVLG